MQKTVNSQAWIHRLMVNNYLTRALLCNIQKKMKIGSQVYNQIHGWNLAYLWLSYSFLSWFLLKYQILTTFLLFFSISFVLLSCICLVSWTPQIRVFCSPVWTPQWIQQQDEWFNPWQTRLVNWLPEIIFWLPGRISSTAGQPEENCTSKQAKQKDILFSLIWGKVFVYGWHFRLLE